MKLLLTPFRLNILTSSLPWRESKSICFHILASVTSLRSQQLSLPVTHRCPPHPEGFAIAQYTSPTIILPDGTYLSDSRKIADEIDKRYPTPSVHLDDPKLKELEGIMPNIMSALVGVYIPLVPVRLLNEASHPHWYSTREKRVGMPLSQLAEQRGGDIGYREAQPFLMAITKMLVENSEGPFFAGKEVGYVDFVWGGFLIFMKRIGDDVYEGVVGMSGRPEVHGKFLEALEPWSARDDH